MGVPYLDVCDDLEYSQESKVRYNGEAANRGIPAIVCGGIYPGVSNLMAAKMIRDIRQSELDSEAITSEETTNDASGQGKVEIEKLLYSYFTAGSGGVGPTILVRIVT